MSIAANQVAVESPRTETSADAIQRTLVRRILRGEIPPGGNLPPVRTLAAEFGVTAPTIQRVVAALEAQRLVEARQGSGVKVLDPYRRGGLSLLPAWFDALHDRPDELARIFEEAMEMRRIVAMHLARRIGTVAASPALLGALDAVREARTVRDLMDADLRVTRAVLDGARHFGATALFNSVEDVLRQTPAVAEAVYGDPKIVRSTLETVVRAVLLGGEEGVVAIGEALAKWDAAATRRFRRVVAQGMR